MAAAPGTLPPPPAGPHAEKRASPHQGAWRASTLPRLCTLLPDDSNPLSHIRAIYVRDACLQVFSIREELENPDVTYPSYYRQPFHAYREGNLSWKAAFEVRPPASGRGG